MSGAHELWKVRFRLQSLQSLFVSTGILTPSLAASLYLLPSFPVLVHTNKVKQGQACGSLRTGCIFPRTWRSMQAASWRAPLDLFHFTICVLRRIEMRDEPRLLRLSLARRSNVHRIGLTALRVR